MPTNLQRLSTCMSSIMAALECPICLDTIPPPAHQCVNGHLICLKCRVKTEKCPVCRIKLSRGRSLLADQVYNSLIDAFDLRGQEESKRRKILKEKLFGHKTGVSKSNKPDIKINFINSPTCKFLNKLIRNGKCSSAENLTTTNSADKNSNLLCALDEMHLGLKAKSLSSNEIFRMDGQSLSRTTSVLSSRPGSGLLDVQHVTYSKRPASYHGSAEELYKKQESDIKSDESLQQKENICDCPCDSNCEKYVTESTFLKHVQEFHEGPMLHHFKPRVECTLPLGYKNSTILAITSFNTLFIIKILDPSLKSDINRVWVWSLNKKGSFTASITVEQDGNTISAECPVLTLGSFGWQKVINGNYGVLLNLKNTTTTLKVEINKSNYS